MIAFDATANGAAEGVTSLTIAHTCTGSNRILMVGCGFYGSSTDVITGVTYNGVAMTLINKQQQTGGVGSYVYLFYLIAPATGANNIVISASVAVNLRGVSASYTGVAQTGQPDASGVNTGVSSTSFAVSLTPVADSCWMISTAINDEQTVSGGTGTTKRNTDSQILGIGDNNAAISPPASTSMTWTLPIARTWAGVKASIAPAVAAAAAGAGYSYFM